MSSTPYGIILALAVAVTWLVDVQGRVLRLWDRRLLYTLLPLVVVFAVWYAYPPKLSSTWGWLVNYPDGVDDPYSVEGWLYYPLALVRIAGSPWLFALYLAGMIYALVDRRRTTTFLVILVLVQVVLGEFHQNKQARYLLPVLPAWFLLAGNLLAGLGRRVARRRPALGVWTRTIMAVLLLVQAGLLLAQLQPGPGDRPEAVTAYVAQTLDLARRTLVLGTTDMGAPTPGLLDWRLAVEQGVLEAPQAGSASQIEEGRRLAQVVGRLPLPGWLGDRLTGVLTAYDRPAALRTLYLGLPLRASYSAGGEAAARFLDDLVQAQAIDQVVLVTSTRAQAVFPFPTVAPWLEATGLTRADGAAFPEVGLQVDVFRR